jgi:hypothetical protein
LRCVANDVIIIDDVILIDDVIIIDDAIIEDDFVSSSSSQSTSGCWYEYFRDIIAVVVAFIIIKITHS